jgi:uncharacterized protein YdaU (DUF1376 family)
MRDPAFLFYSKDFYEGTRTLLPEERGIFIDLLIYQHQHDFIPTDLKRIIMYCSGSTQAMLEAVLEAKFKLCDRGWYNEALAKVVEDRKQFSEKQSVNGTIGQFWKKAKGFLNSKDYQKLKNCFFGLSQEQTLEIIQNETEITQATLEAMLEAMLKHLAIVNANEDKDKEKGMQGEKGKEEVYHAFAHLKISVAENQKLIEAGYTQDEIIQVYRAIENYTKNKNYKSLYLTTINWLVKNFGKRVPLAQQPAKKPPMTVEEMRGW